MKDLSIVQHQTELEEKAGNEQQWRRELLMVAQDNDAKHGDGNSRLVAYHENDNLKLQNENIKEYQELHEQIQAYLSSKLEILDQKFKQELDRMAKDAYRETQRYAANFCNLSFIFLKKSDRSLKIMTCWMEAIGNIAPRILYMSQMRDRHLNEHEGKFTVDQVRTYSVPSQHEHNHEDNQRKKMKSSEELIQLLQTETTHIVKMNEQSLIQAKPILKTSSRRGDPVDD